MRNGKHAELTGWARMALAGGFVAMVLGVVLAFTSDSTKIAFGSIALTVLGGALTVGGMVFGALAITAQPDAPGREKP